MDILDWGLGEFVAFLVVVFIFVFWSGKRAMVLDEKRQAAWALMARPLGLTYKRGGTLTGEVEGLAVRIGQEEGAGMGRRRRNEDVYVVRVDVPGMLPRDFVAAPRKWASLLERAGAVNVFKAGEPVLDKAHIFQCESPEAGRKLLQDTDVQQALRDLVQPGSVSFVQGNHVGLAYRTPTFVENAATVRHNLARLVRAAHALAQAQERFRSAA